MLSGVYVKVIIGLMIGFFLSLFGYNVVLPYIVGLFIIYPIIVAMWIDSWKRQDKVMVESNKNRYIFIVNGFPIEEEISSLFNLLVNDEHLLESKFKKLFSLKLLFLLILTFFGIQQFIEIVNTVLLDHQNYVLWVALVISGLFTFYLLYRLIVCFNILTFIRQRRWHIIHQEHDHQRYYAAYYPCLKNSQINGYIPLLALVFK